MAVTTLAQSKANTIQIAGRDVYNSAAVLVGTIVTLQTAITAGSARNQVPDIVDAESKLNTLLLKLQDVVTEINRINSDLAIP